MWPTSARAGCVGPQLSIGEEVLYDASQTAGRLAPGQQVKVTGEWFHDGCDDVHVGGGCATDDEREKQTPMKNVELVVKQGQLEWQVDRDDASGKRSTVRWDIRVPTDLAAGPAELFARTKGGQQGQPIRILVEKATRRRSRADSAA